VPSEICRQLGEQGFAGPVPVLSTLECCRFLTVLFDPRRRPPLDWPKGYAANARAFYEIGTHPAILKIVSELLGENVMLWGASLQIQRPASNHAWHSDMETSGPTGRTVSVWIGLENATTRSSLDFVSYSHRFGATVQEIRAQTHTARGDTTPDNIIAWAKQRDPRAAFVRPEMSNGQALFFQGQLWHHSENTTTEKRRALLLQYATPETPIRIPDLNYLDWPFKQRETPRPACIMIRGSDMTGINRIVSAPAPAAERMNTQLTNLVYPLPIPLQSDGEKGFKPYAMFNGSTSDLREMDVHVSVLNQHQSPHPPHAHREEEILVLLSGEVDVLLPQARGLYGDERHPLQPGEFVYYPAHFPHTLRTTSVEPANYLMFKWLADPTGATSPLGFHHLSTRDPAAGPAGEPYRTRILFEGITGWLRKLHCHVSILEPGAGYAPHADAYDVAIVLLEGEIETLGQRVQPHAVVYHPAGELHGIKNPGTIAARYLVLEFHGSQSARSEAFPKPDPTLLEKVTDPRRWVNKLKRVSKKLRGA